MFARLEGSALWKGQGLLTLQKPLVRTHFPPNSLNNFKCPHCVKHQPVADVLRHARS